MMKTTTMNETFSYDGLQMDFQKYVDKVIGGQEVSEDNMKTLMKELHGKYVTKDKSPEEEVYAPTMNQALDTIPED